MRLRILSILILLVPLAAHAQFHDQGMLSTPKVKTEYVDPKTGTAARPLVIGDCLWGNCRPERLVFQSSNHWEQNLSCVSCPAPQQGTYWTVLLNNEPRADLRNSGPPDASLPRAVPTQGLMGFATLHGDANLPGDRRWRAHLVLDLIGIENPVFGAIPFLSFGEFSNRGNRDKPLGYLRPSSTARPSVLSFGARLWDATPPTPIEGGTQPATLAAYVWMLANWGTKPKAIFITLYHYNIQNSAPPGNPAINHFSWPISQSALYPGADIVYIDAEDMNYYCNFNLPTLAPQQDIDYRIDLTALFACVSNRSLFTEPMPATSDIPVTQVLWANESTGVNGDLWIDVHDQKIVASPTNSSTTKAHVAGASGKSKEQPRTTREIREALARQCDDVSGCGNRARLAAEGRQRELELPVERQPSRPDLLKGMPEITSPQDKH